MPTYKDKNGKWFCKFYYTDYSGKRRQKKKEGFTLKREAEAFEREFLQNISYQPDMTFSAFYDLYKNDRAGRVRAHSLKTEYYRMKNRILPFFGELRLCDITPQIVIQWQNTLIADGLAQTTLAGLHVQLSAIFNHACRYYGLKKNPARQAGGIGAKKPQTEMRIYTLEEFTRLIGFIDDLKAKTAIILLFWSGMRKGELLALTWSDVDFKAGTVSITKSYQRLGGKDVITPPKTAAGVRVIMLPDIALNSLTAYKKLLYDVSDTDTVFPWEKYFIDNAIKKASAAAGLHKIRVHDLRHSHASLLIELGYSPLLIAKRLGHEKIETTLNTYSHLWPNKEAEMIEELNRL